MIFLTNSLSEGVRGTFFTFGRFCFTGALVFGIFTDFTDLDFLVFADLLSWGGVVSRYHLLIFGMTICIFFTSSALCKMADFCSGLATILIHLTNAAII